MHISFMQMAEGIPQTAKTKSVNRNYFRFDSLFYCRVREPSILSSSTLVYTLPDTN
jgi:hypothetical protein